MIMNFSTKKEQAIQQFFQNFSIEKRTLLKESLFLFGINWVIFIADIIKSWKKLGVCLRYALPKRY